MIALALALLAPTQPAAPDPAARPPSAALLPAPALRAAPAAPAPLPQFSGVADVRFSVLYGLRDFDSDLAPADEHHALGIALHVREPRGLLGFECGYTYSSGDGSQDVPAVGRLDAKCRIHELWAGGRWTFEPFGPHVRPYLGAGASLLRASYEVSGQGGSENDTSLALGLYAHAGVEWEIAGGWSLGLDARALLSNDAQLQADTPLDYVQVGLTLGWAW